MVLCLCAIVLLLLLGYGPMSVSAVTYVKLMFWMWSGDFDLDIDRSLQDEGMDLVALTFSRHSRLTQSGFHSIAPLASRPIWNMSSRGYSQLEAQSATTIKRKLKFSAAILLRVSGFGVSA